MVNPFPSEKANFYALQLQNDLDKYKCLDYEDECQFKTDKLFTTVKGQMFGVLVTLDKDDKEVILKAFSGQYNKKWLIKGWVGPCFDAEKYEVILAEAQTALDKASDEEKKVISFKAQQELNSLYKFHTLLDEVLSIDDIFETKIPPSGTGDCCTIKLLNEAFKRGLRPIGLAEFFYGESNDSLTRFHKQFYPPCESRCKTLLTKMLSLEIVFKDDDLVVVNKEAGLLSVPGRLEENYDSVSTRIKKLYVGCLDQPAVHRLDMDTSGLIVLALNQESHRKLSIQFIKKQIDKRYVALLEGVIKENNGKIELAFRYDPENKPRQKYDPVLGKWGTTLWEKIRVEPLTSKKHLVTRVFFTPITGRTHQLRVHSAHPKGLNSPIVGDNLYGNREENQRLMLHATLLTFTHPITKERLTFTSKEPF
jgi:tRNA pseudouridine32 synthase/23S rRNA pseudouridine746 synthase